MIATLPCLLTCGTGQKQRTDAGGATICCFTAKCNTSQRFRFCQKDQGYDICQDCPPDQYTNDPINTSQWNEETDVCVLKPDCSAPEKILVGNKCECDRSKGYFGTDPDNCGIKVDDCKIAGYQLNNYGNCIECGPNQFKPGIDQVGICQDKRKCKDGEIEENPGNTTSDRICKKQEKPTSVVPEIITTTETTYSTVNKQIIKVAIAVAFLVFVVIVLCWKRNTLRETFKGFNICKFFNARCKECKKRDRLDPEENEHMLDKVENGRLQNGIGRQSSNGSAGNGHIIGSDGDSIPMSTFQDKQESSTESCVPNGKPGVKRNTGSTQSDTNMKEHHGQQNSYHMDSASEQASGLTMNTFIDGSEAASICENKIETKDRTKMPHSGSKTYNSLNADSILQDGNSFGEQVLNQFCFCSSSPQTQSPVLCDRDPDTIPKTMSDNFSIESTDLKDEINHQSRVPEIPAANPTVKKEILKPQTRVKPMAKVFPVRSTSQDQQANAQSSVNGAEGFTPSPTTANGIDIQQAVNNDSHKVVANTHYGEYPDMRENNTEDATNSAQGPPPSMDSSEGLRQQPSLSTNHESPPTDEINHIDNNEQLNLHETASGNVLATPSSDNSRESESNQSLQQETVNQAPDTYSYP
ncbi:unnamed protein product [Mytilus edulis]|uniref:Uncharacterized protein n=1 Tax=Mytilus edulis TaxID=6550 RepID=A0A8S3RDX0_MYTED|nr:unnamed protein product [Mytilus edulis]